MSFSNEINLTMRTMTIIFAVISNLASVGSKIAIQKDWLFVVANNDVEKLTKINSIFRTIDLVSCKKTRPVWIGFKIVITNGL